MASKNVNFKELLIKLEFYCVTAVTGIQKTSIGESLLCKSYNAPRIFENSINETLSEKISEDDQSALKSPESMNHQNEVKSSNSKISLRRSDSFPQMSSSRRIENINIVFPQTLNSPLPNLPKLNPVCLPLDITFDINVNSSGSSEANKFDQTFENSLSDILSEDDKLKTPKRRNKVKPTSCFKMNLANAISPKPYSKKVNTFFETSASDSNVVSIFIISNNFYFFGKNFKENCTILISSLDSG